MLVLGWRAGCGMNLKMEIKEFSGLPGVRTVLPKNTSKNPEQHFRLF